MKMGKTDKFKATTELGETVNSTGFIPFKNKLV